MDQTATQGTTQGAGAELTHTVYPACRCGHSWAAHRCQGWYSISGDLTLHDDCACHTYSPTLPVEEFTAAYRPWSTTRGVRRLVCVACWRLEQWARSSRRKWERRT